MSQGELFTTRKRCSNGKCASAGPNTPCECSACRGTLHNPPSQRLRRGRKAKRSGTGQRGGCACRGGTCTCARGEQRTRSARTKLPVALLGEAREIIYRGADGQLYRHKFGKSARLYRTVQGSQLIIAPVRVQEFIV